MNHFLFRPRSWKLKMHSNLQPRQAADELQDLIIKVIQAITCSRGHWSSKRKVTKNGQAALQTHTSREFHVFLSSFCWFRNCSTHAKSHSSTQDFDGLLLLPAFHEGDALLLLASGKCRFLDGQSWSRTLHYTIWVTIRILSVYILSTFYYLLSSLSHVSAPFQLSSKDPRQTWLGNPGCCWACLSFIACSGFTLGWCCLGMIPKSSSWIKLVSEFDWIFVDPHFGNEIPYISHLFW